MNEPNIIFIHPEGGKVKLDKKQALKTAAYEVFSKKGYKAINVNLKMYKSGNLKMYNFTH